MYGVRAQVLIGTVAFKGSFLIRSVSRDGRPLGKSIYVALRFEVDNILEPQRRLPPVNIAPNEKEQ